MPARRLQLSATARPARSAAALAIAAASAAGCAASPGAGGAVLTPTADTAVAANAVVVGVVDGDTIDVDVGGRRERVRLIGIDTPETKKPDAPVECYGPEATAFTEAALPASTPVRLERDLEPRDAFGRLLAYVYRASDGLFVNRELVALGLARPFRFEPNTAHAAELALAAAAAERRSLGLWAACSG